ncbi:GEM-like protein 4 [Abeliophyllum distichum]|uniref:GEM-like protein 4 n=1 Tax=Abeliophyllum distichum TaxID=126358 RepID=A0ABD1VY52_9LAMI
MCYWNSNQLRNILRGQIPKKTLPDSASQYSVVPSPSNEYFKIGHMKLGPKLTDREVAAGSKNPSEPIAGLLFISTVKVAFCSERPMKLSSPSGKLLKMHYKVMIPLGKIKRAKESENAKKPKQKYVQIVTEDNFEFWFMGFLNRQKAFKYLQQATSRAPSVADINAWLISP